MALGGDLLVSGVADVKEDVLARRDRERWFDRVVPDVAVGVGTHLVQRVLVHGSSWWAGAVRVFHHTRSWEDRRDGAYHPGVVWVGKG
jgi:hypothetical protein